MKPKFLIYLLTFFSMIMISFSEELQANPVSDRQKAVFEKVIQNYSVNNCFEYDILYHKKIFDSDSFMNLRYNMSLIKSHEDSIFGCYFFYNYLLENKMSYKYYDGKKLYVIDTGKKQYTIFDPFQGQKAPVTGAFDGSVILASAFFDPQKIREMFYSEKANIERYDTVIKSTPYIVYRTNFDNSEDYTDQYRVIYINCNSNLIDRIFWHVSYKGQTQIDDIVYKNFSLKKLHLDDLNSLFRSSIKGYAEVIYQPKKIDTLSLGSSIPSFKGKLYPGQEDILLPEDNKITVYDFWYTSCIPCIKTIPAINKVYKKYKNIVHFYGIDPLPDDIENPKRINTFLQRTPILYLVILANYDDLSALKISSFPTLYIVDGSGKLVFKQYGYNEQEDLFEILDKKLSELLQ